jgi:AraC-like DNA-binding protein
VQHLNGYASIAAERNWLARYSFYRSPRLIGSPRDPYVVAESCDVGDGVSLIQWMLTDSLELLSDGADPDYRSKFCVYTADQTTWIETGNHGMQEIPAHDVVFLSSDIPIHTMSVQNTRHLTLVLPRSLVTRYIPAADSICGRGLPHDCDMAHVVRSIMLALKSGMNITHSTSVKTNLVSGLLMALCDLDKSPKDGGSPRVSNKIRLIEDVIADRYADPDLGVEEIARSLHLSVRYLHTICQGRVSPAEMIRQYRLRKAEEMLGALAGPERSITDIALACGFNSSSYFSTSFKSYAGVSPRAYRSSATGIES